VPGGHAPLRLRAGRPAGSHSYRFFVTPPADFVYYHDMKSLFFLPLALLLGLVIGGWTPNEELRALRKERDALNAKQADREKDSRMDAITRMIQIPDRAAKKPTAKAAPPSEASAAAPPEATNGVHETAAAPTAPPIPSGGAQTRAPAPEDLRTRIEEAKELWATRVQIARTQWLNRLKLTPEQTELFDAAINVMNEELYASMQGMADALAADEAVTPELGMRFFSEMTASIVQAYDDLATFVPAEQRGEAAQIELSDFIDPTVAEPLIAVQDKLENMPRPPSGRRFHRSPR
jgi:hypothetical protein